MVRVAIGTAIFQMCHSATHPCTQHLGTSLHSLMLGPTMLSTKVVRIIYLHRK